MHCVAYQKDALIVSLNHDLASYLLNAHGTVIRNIAEDRLRITCRIPMRVNTFFHKLVFGVVYKVLSSVASGETEAKTAPGTTLLVTVILAWPT